MIFVPLFKFIHLSVCIIPHAPLSHSCIISSACILLSIQLRVRILSEVTRHKQHTQEPTGYCLVRLITLAHSAFMVFRDHLFEYTRIFSLPCLSTLSEPTGALQLPCQPGCLFQVPRPYDPNPQISSDRGILINAAMSSLQTS